EFASWGIPTADSLRQVREVAPDLPVIASGGVRSGIDVAKAVALGAVAAGVAGPALRAAAASAEALVDSLQQLIDELRITMFCAGAGTLADLRDGGRLVAGTAGEPIRSPRSQLLAP